jgi:HlyD family secretion protein
VIVDFVDPPTGLGDGFKVEAGIVIWAADRVLTVPAGALFRSGETWNAFVVRGGRAVLTPVEAGQRTAAEVQIRGGLERADTVVVRPPRALASGALVLGRPTTR